MPIRRLAAGLALSVAGLAAIITHEAMVPVVYEDVVGVNTVCVGHVTKLPVGTRVAPEVCEEYLRGDTVRASAAVRSAVKVPVTQEQFDALVSFTFNVGSGAFRSSTLLRKLNAGDCRGAGAEFMRWTKAQGKVWNGLVKRRAAERRLFETGCAA